MHDSENLKRAPVLRAAARPLVAFPMMGKIVPGRFDQMARVCHEANRAYCRTLGDDSQPSWDDAPDWQKISAIDGIAFRIANPGATAESMHSNWVETKLKDGWAYGAKKDPEKKTHPCMLPYSDLPPAQRVKDELFSAIVDVMNKQWKT
jgi:hypothetical protein